jgi:ribulose-bisphosphate carboxylase large chain
MNIFRENINTEKYIVVTYFLESSTSLRDAAWGLAIGQSVGNPNVRSIWETDQLFENHSCMIIADENQLKSKKSGEVKIGFPVANLDINTDGISHLLCQIMGGQMDIDTVEKCQVKNIKFPDSVLTSFQGPKYGIKGIRSFTKSVDKPILGGIVKPKIGVTSKVLTNMVEEMVAGGVNFIKEDEIMSNPAICPIEERVPLVMDVLKGTDVIYAVCINSDAPYLLDRVKKVCDLGGNSVHVNFWSGLGAYKSIRDLNLPLFIHFQKSGDKILTNKNHDYHISWNVICDLAGLMGVDFIHAGMWGGYMSDNEEDLKETLRILHNRNVMPALSCGMNPGLVQAINKRFGFNYMANVGGALHGHPGGTKAGVLAMRQSIDGNHEKEYQEAIKKWGIVQ